MEKNNKKKLLIFSMIGVFLIGIAISFAYWQIVLQQSGKNVVTTDCFQVTFKDGEGITIPNAHPISDEEGMLVTPYDFTITNICNNRVQYQINLETMTPEGKQLPEKYLKANLMEENVSKITTKLLSEINVEPTITGATASFQLLNGELGANEEKTFHLRLWMHGEVTTSDADSMNATYEGKISVITSYMEPLKTLATTMKILPKVTSGSGLYEVNHSDADITYTSDPEIQNMFKQTEYRYAGSNPNNYVKFNNELWRIIGLVNTPEGQRVKIIRSESIGEYSWSSSSSDINNGWGINEWSQSGLMNVLNRGAYFNRTSGSCEVDSGSLRDPCDFSETGLLNESKPFIDSVTWNLGSNDGTSYTNENITVANFYNFERSNHNGKICDSGNYCNDSVERTLTWNGKVGLMYPSDYGYAVGGTRENRETCFNTTLFQWSNHLSCSQNVWLDNGNAHWTLTPMARPTFSTHVFRVGLVGSVSDDFAYKSFQVYPTVYLQSVLKVASGTGSIDSPYHLTM